MRTVDYSEILYGSAALAGSQPADIDAATFALLRTFHDRRLQTAWEIHRWPDLCPIEKRTYREAWSATTTYAAKDECYDLASGNYFQSLKAANLNQAPTIAGVENAAYWAACANAYSAADWVTGTDYTIGQQVKNALTGIYYQARTNHTAGATFAGDLAANWGELTPFNKYIAYAQPGETPIGEYLQATNRDPRITTQHTCYSFFLSQDGAQFSYLAPNVLWLYYRIQRPTLVGNAWDSTSTYASGDQVYYAATSGGVGNFYTANTSTTAGQSPTTTPASWDVVELPYFLRGYLIQAGYADWLISDGQTDKALAHDGFARDFLELEADKLQRQQQQVRRLNVAG
jgi:hypothetical protein